MSRYVRKVVECGVKAPYSTVMTCRLPRGHEGSDPASTYRGHGRWTETQHEGFTAGATPRLRRFIVEYYLTDAGWEIRK